MSQTRGDGSTALADTVERAVELAVFGGVPGRREFIRLVGARSCFPTGSR